MKKPQKYYCVAVDEWFDVVFESTNKKKALEKAYELTRDPEYDGVEINITVSPSKDSADIISIITVRPMEIIRQSLGGI